MPLHALAPSSRNPATSYLDYRPGSLRNLAGHIASPKFPYHGIGASRSELTPSMRRPDAKG